MAPGTHTGVATTAPAKQRKPCIMPCGSKPTCFGNRTAALTNGPTSTGRVLASSTSASGPISLGSRKDVRTGVPTDTGTRHASSRRSRRLSDPMPWGQWRHPTAGTHQHGHARNGLAHHASPREVGCLSSSQMAGIGRHVHVALSPTEALTNVPCLNCVCLQASPASEPSVLAATLSRNLFRRDRSTACSSLLMICRPNASPRSFRN